MTVLSASEPLVQDGVVHEPTDAPLAVAFEPFYAGHRDRIARALALTLGDAQLAVEATDEAMTRAVQHWAKVSGYTDPAGWVYRVGLNWARNRFRRRRRDRVYAPLIASPTVAPADGFDPTVREALAHLSDDHRAVVVCRYYLDWSVDRTAHVLEISPGTVKSRLSRAIDQLATHLGPRPQENQ